MSDLPATVRDTVPRLRAPSPAERAAAVGGSHADLAGWPALAAVELVRPPAPADPPETLRVGAWNLERCKDVDGAAAVLLREGVDVLLATEMDRGLARSANRDTVGDLAARLGMGHAFAVEFVELGTGDAWETERHGREPSDEGLHGNAILSRLPLLRPARVPVAPDGLWFGRTPKGDGQSRVGGRMAVTAGVEMATGPVTLAAVHYESESDAEGRAAQTGALTAALGRGPAVIGGDLNTKALAGVDEVAVVAAPQGAEPAFAAFAEAGFDWRAANAPGPTTRAPPGRPARYPLMRLDWLLARGLVATAPRTVAAVSPVGGYVSDHELIVCDVRSPTGSPEEPTP